mgnify:FL=1
MKVEITTAKLLNAQCSPGRKKEEWVDLTSPTDPHRGMYCTIKQSNNDRIPFHLRMKVDGKTTHCPIGYFPDSSFMELREKTVETRALAQAGHIITQDSKRPDKKDPIFLDFLQDTYLPYKQNHKRSWKDDKAIINLRIKPSKLAKKHLSEISRQDIEALASEILATGKKPATVNHVTKVIRHSLSLAVSWSYLEKNVASGIRLFHEDNEVNNILTEPQLKKLLEVLNTHENRTVSNICLWLLSTGARLNEALKAEYTHIYREKRLWVIPAKNNKGKRLRSVPLNDTALSVLDQLTTKESDVYLFLNEKIGKPYTTIHKTWSHIRQLAGVPFLRLHDLRHSFASFLAESSVSMLEIAGILGHKNLEISKRYTHLSSSKLLEASSVASQKNNKAIGS